MQFITDSIKTAGAEALKVATRFNKILSLSFCISLISSLLILGLVLYTVITTIRHKKTQQEQVHRVKKQTRQDQNKRS